MKTVYFNVLLLVCHLPIGIQGQVGYLIVSIPDICTLTYFCYENSSVPRDCALSGVLLGFDFEFIESVKGKQIYLIFIKRWLLCSNL